MNYARKWTMTNGLITMRVCDVCAQPYREGHIDCSCPENHPEPCNRPTYSRLTRERDALLSAAKAALDFEAIALAEDTGHCDACGTLSDDLGGAINPICTDGQFCPACLGLDQ